MDCISSVKLILFDFKGDISAKLTIFPSPDKVPFLIKRIFAIHAQEAIERGHHAHKECAQLLVCLHGKCCVIVDDGQERVTYNLTHSHEGLLIPPSLWAEQVYEKDTILMVLADQPFDENDYIRNYEQFLEYRKTVQ